MYAAERQQAIADLVARTGRVAVVDLSAEFEVTTETVRRDLSNLERAGQLRRVHGGAVSTESVTFLEAGLSDRDQLNIEAKDAIAEAAAALIPSGESTILLDAGSTTARVAERLPRDRRLTVFTHSVPIATRLAGLPHIDLHLLPGHVRRTTLAAVGVETVAAVEALRVDLAFVGTNGLTVGHGLSTPDQTEAAVKSAMVRRAGRVVVTTDASKIGVERTVRFATIDEVDVVVCDDALDAQDRRRLSNAGPEVVIA